MMKDVRQVFCWLILQRISLCWMDWPLNRQSWFLSLHARLLLAFWCRAFSPGRSHLWHWLFRLWSFWVRFLRIAFSLVLRVTKALTRMRRQIHFFVKLYWTTKLSNLLVRTTSSHFFRVMLIYSDNHFNRTSQMPRRQELHTVTPNAWELSLLVSCSILVRYFLVWLQEHPSRCSLLSILCSLLLNQQVWPLQMYHLWQERAIQLERSLLLLMTRATSM